MRLVFVNHCHPDTPHVCATRARELAKACAAAGHETVLLTETLDQNPTGTDPARLADDLQRAGRPNFLHVACPPRGGALVRALREGRVPRLLRRPLLAASYAARSGLFTDWRDGAHDLVQVLARHFRPDAVWGTFGNTDAWIIARSLARESGAKWIADVKDPWSAFIPGMLQKLIAGRLSDMDVLTALSDQHGAEAGPWFGKQASTIYSGIDDGFLEPPPSPPGDDRILLLGALYAQTDLNELLKGLINWRPNVQIIYAGSEIARLRAACAGTAIRLETPGYVDLPALRALAARCDGLAYVRAPRALFQHKAIELPAMDRPIFCLPEEAPESLRIAARLGATLRSCSDAAALTRALHDEIGSHRPIDRTALAGFTWAAQARKLMEAII